MTRVFRFGDQDLAVSVQKEGQGLRVVLDGGEGRFVSRDAEGAWILDLPGGGRRRFWVHAGRDLCRVFAEGRVFEFALPDPDLDEAEEEGVSGPRLVADMPGKVVKVLVAVGDRVVVGQPLVIMESMKMETELAASVAGTVAGIPAAAGQVVGQGDLLVEIEPQEEP